MSERAAALVIASVGALTFCLGALLYWGPLKRAGRPGWDSEAASRGIRGFGLGGMIGGAGIFVAGILLWIFS